jgi:predicted RND superfamily exporter protein
MAQQKTFYARYSLIILMAFFFASPLILQSAQRAIKSNKNRVQDWLPQTFRETTELRWFRKHFIADQFVLVSWEGCALGGNPELPDSQPDDPRIERLARFLEPSGPVKPGEPAGYEGMFQKVTTARRLIEDLTSKPSEVPYSEAVKRLEGTLIGPDGKQTCVVVMLSDAAIPNFRKVLGRHVANGSLPWQRKPGILWDALEQCGIDKTTVRLGGPPVENVAIDEEGGRTIARLGSLSAVLGLCLAYWSLRNVVLTLIVFTCGILAAAAGLAVVIWTGSTTDAILMSMPSMTYVLAISGAIHLVNYYREAIKEHGLEGAPDRAIAHGWKPALFCSVTTAIGVGSLSISDLEPIRKFGTYSAISMLMILIVLFLFLPAALTMWPMRSWEKKRLTQKKKESKVDLGAGTIWSEKLWASASNFLVRHHVAVSTICLLFIVFMGFGVTKTRTQIDLLKLFDSQARVRTDYEWLEQNVGRLVPLEVVVRFPPEMIRSENGTVKTEDLANTLSFLERLEAVSLVQDIIDQELGPNGNDLVGPTMAAATFAPDVPKGPRDVWSVARRSVTNEQLEVSHRNLSKSGYLTTDHDDNAELWRVSLRAAAFRGLDYGLFVESVRKVIEPVLAGQRLRQVVLAQLVAERGDKSLAGAKICLWDQTAEPLLDGDEKSPTSQQQLYMKTAEQLLLKARLKLTRTSADLATLPEASRDQLFTKLRAFDSVVLTGDFTESQVREIQQAGVHVIDARNLLADQIDDSLNPGAGLNHIAARYTGVVPIVYKAQRALLESLMESTLGSFATITPLLMLVSWSIAGGAVAMLPNALPVLVVFGGMGWLGIPVDIGSMMSASIALGVAVDDTIHFLTRYREVLPESKTRSAAIRSAYAHCAPPTLQAAMISGLGLSVFIFSSFTPTQRMGWLMMVILFTGVVAELVMLPAILAGPLGNAFSAKMKPRKRRDDDRDDAPPSEIAPKSATETHAVRHEPAHIYASGNGHGKGNGNGESQPTHDSPHPHAWTLRERLANLRREARQ